LCLTQVVLDRHVAGTGNPVARESALAERLEDRPIAGRVAVGAEIADDGDRMDVAVADRLVQSPERVAVAARVGDTEHAGHASSHVWSLLRRSLRRCR
jgi:microcystin degradation protein MlrC